MIKFDLSIMTMNLNKFALIAYYFQNIHWFLNADNSHVFCLKKYRTHKCMFDKIFAWTICKQPCHLNEIYIYQVEKNKRPNSISMRMFPKVKFIFYQNGCGESYPLEKIHQHEMCESPHRSILCPAQGCQFSNYVKTLIIYLINCFVFIWCIA